MYETTLLQLCDLVAPLIYNLMHKYLFGYILEIQNIFLLKNSEELRSKTHSI